MNFPEQDVNSKVLNNGLIHLNKQYEWSSRFPMILMLVARCLVSTRVIHCLPSKIPMILMLVDFLTGGFLLKFYFLTPHILGWFPEISSSAQKLLNQLGFQDRLLEFFFDRADFSWKFIFLLQTYWRWFPEIFSLAQKLLNQLNSLHDISRP